MTVPQGFRDHWESFEVSAYAGWLPALDWVREKYGLDPDSIPIDSYLTIDYQARTITTEYFARDDAGRLVLDGNQVRRVMVVQPMESRPEQWPFAVVAGKPVGPL